MIIEKMRKNATYSLSFKAIEKIQALAKEENITQSDLIEKLVWDHIGVVDPVAQALDEKTKEIKEYVKAQSEEICKTIYCINNRDR